MSLSGRLCFFFLGSLALVLVCFGIALYLLTATYFSRRSDERLSGAIETLASAAEVQRDGLEWEPNSRYLTLGQDADEDAVRWTVADSAGHLIDRSPNLNGADLSDNQRWRTSSRVVELPGVSLIAATGSHARLKRYDRLTLLVAVSPQPGRLALSQLARALAITGVVTWLLAAAVGRWLCRRALAPVRRMATAAATMTAADLDRRIDLPRTGDELDDLGKAFNGLLGRLEAAFERQRRFSGDAAHQLSTPLTGLLGQLEVALRRERPASEYRAALTEALSGACHLRQIVELLLFLARPEADVAPPETETIDLVTWLPQHLMHWKTQPRWNDMRLDGATDEPLLVKAAPVLLGQLLDNLLDNACKYSSEGTPIGIRTARSVDAVLLQVEDHGPGIAAEDMPQIFEPFFRSPEARRLGKPGVGLGLAVARRLADALGATLEAENLSGEGTRFTLRLSPANH